ncbi:MAG TPA: alkaline phosphatase family protein [Gemmatimonadales bacterium]
MLPDRRVVFLLMDGARPDVFEDLVAAGELPHIGRWILDRGAAVPATTVFPSTTGVAYLPMLTGCYPGTCNVPGIRWVDTARYAGSWWRDRHHVRSYCGYQGGLLNDDIPGDMPTLFDLVPDAVALCTPFTRGLAAGNARLGLARQIWGGLAHYTEGYGILERAVGAELCRLAPDRHRLVFAVLPGVDGVTHFHDPWHPAVCDMYRGVDRLVGEYGAAGGIDDETLVLLVSDHGLGRIDRHTDLSLELEARGVATMRHPFVWRRHPRVAVMVSGNASAQIYLAPGELRGDRYTIERIETGAVPGVPADIVAFLTQLPGVAMVVARAEAGLACVSRAGRALLYQADGGRIGYRPQPIDVLALGGAGEYSGHEWLARSIDLPYPDAPEQLMQLAWSGRVGDLVVIAEPGADLRRRWEVPEHRSGHGSLIKEHMRCLIAANTPLTGPVRTTDLFPLMLDHLGIPVPDGIDGSLPHRGAS